MKQCAQCMKQKTGWYERVKKKTIVFGFHCPVNCKRVFLTYLLQFKKRKKSFCFNGALLAHCNIISSARDIVLVFCSRNNFFLHNITESSRKLSSRAYNNRYNKLAFDVLFPLLKGPKLSPNGMFCDRTPRLRLCIEV